MPVNEFEKQVQQKMDEFRLRPSAPVWEKIKDDINERKRRRIFFMMSLTAAALLFGWIGYNYFFTHSKIQSVQNETAIKNNGLQQTIDNEQIKNQEAVGSKDNRDVVKQQEQNEINTNTGTKKEVVKQTVTGTGAHAETTIKEPSINTKTKNLQSNKNSNAVKNIATGKNARKPDFVFAPVGINAGENADLVKSNSEQQKDNNDIITITGDEPGSHLQKDAAPVSLSDIAILDLSANIATNNSPVVTLPVISSTAPLKFSRKIKWGVTAMGGITSRAKEPFDIFGSGSAEKSLSAAAPSFSLGNITGGVLVLPPSDVKPGAAFKLGVIVEKPLSRRFTISSGLQYAYSSDHITIGKSTFSGGASNAMVDRNYYSAGLSQWSGAVAGNPGLETTNYTNKYHFIELPLTVNYTINKKWKNPFVWNAGLSVGQLITTNALLYDVAYGGVYYDAKDEMKKTQLNVFTGFAFQFAVNRLQWSVGPQVSINTSRLFENAYDNNRHPVFGGLNVRILFPSKKK